MFCGSDIAHAPKLITDAHNIAGFLSDMHIYESRIKDILEVKKYLTVPVKSFEMFDVRPLGDKIYFYGRTEKDRWTEVFKKHILDSIIKHFGEDKVLIGLQGNTMETMRDEYYARSFINLNFTKEVGFTSCLEMAHMGRKSISNYPARFCVPYKDEKSILNMIECEARRIGTVRDDIASAARQYYQASDEWLNVDFWK